MKAFIFIALLVIAHCSDTSDDDNYPDNLIGQWTFSDTTVLSSTDCCLPSGAMTISKNPNNSITVTATSWVGALCGSRSSAYNQVLSGLNGADTWNQLTSASEEITLTDSNGDQISVNLDLLFDENLLGITINSVDQCGSYFTKISN